MEPENAENATAMPPETETPKWQSLPDGEYAIVELFGHTTLVGRIAEVERFGAKMMALEPLFNEKLLDPIYHGGAAIYRLSPCSREIAWQKQPTQVWQLPPAIKAVVPATALPAPATVEGEPADTADAETYYDDEAE